jgi:transglutaminase-like putative cysteine protease
MTRVDTFTVGYGDDGVRQSLDVMTAAVDLALDSPDVVFFARQLAARAGVRRPYRQALAIQNFLERTWRFVDDPYDRDTFVVPDVALREYAATGVMTGDCDEAATMGAALGRAIGLHAQFVVLFFDTLPDASVQHVFTVLLTDDGRQVSLDVTRPRGPVPAPTRTMVVDV